MIFRKKELKSKDMSIDTNLKLLINLARIDGDVDPKELEHIKNIALASGISKAELDLLVSQSHNVLIPQNLTDEQRFECIFNLVQLMKIDERLFENEMKYCSQIAYKLGYNQSVMFELMLNVKTVKMEKSEIDNLRRSTIKHLREE